MTTRRSTAGDSAARSAKLNSSEPFGRLTPEQVRIVAVCHELDRLYPGTQALLLTKLCGPGCAGHGAQSTSGGWATVPCETPGKRPLERGFNAAATARARQGSDEQRDVHILATARHFADGGNVGWVVPDDCLVMDADTAEAVALCMALLPIAPRQRTRKGAHFVVRLRAGEAKRLKAKVKVPIAPGVEVDLRAGGKSQIACEPSVHATGASYSWEVALPANASELPELPDSLRAQLRAGGAYLEAPGERPIAGRRRPVSPSRAHGRIREPGRNDALFRVACGMRRDGATQNEMMRELWIVNRDRCAPPLAEDEVRKIVASAARYQRGFAR